MIRSCLRGAVIAAVAVGLLGVSNAAQGTDDQPSGQPPYAMANPGPGSQLITVVGKRMGSTTATLRWWQKNGGQWQLVGEAPAMLGSRGLTDGATRIERTGTTPTGLFTLPFAFGNASNPGTAMAYRKIKKRTYWCSDRRSPMYNRWMDGLQGGCRRARSEHMSTYTTYVHGLVTGFNYRKPVKGRGSAIFLHAYGTRTTAGCVSINKAALVEILRWIRPDQRPRIAIGTESGISAL